MPYQVVVEPAGRTFSVEPEQTVLAAAIAQKVALPYGCKDGACGSCKCRKRAGDVRMQPYQPKALSEAEREEGFVLTCRALPQSDLVLESPQVTAVDAFAVRKMPCRVVTLERLSHDVMRLCLQLPAAEAFEYHAGQYIEFILRDGDRRAYSMATMPGGRESQILELHIRHTSGGKFTDLVFSTLKERDILRIEGPFGGFYLREDAQNLRKPVILLASGTGFAPIKAVLERMQYLQTSRPITLYWGGRRPFDLYMDDWVKAQCAQMPNLHYVPVVSEAQSEDAWTGRTGLVHAAVMQDISDLSNHEVYACGSPIVVASAKRDFSTLRALPVGAFYADAFETAADKAKASVLSLTAD